jgi:hypothetical protein
LITRDATLTTWRCTLITKSGNSPTPFDVHNELQFRVVEKVRSVVAPRAVDAPPVSAISIVRTTTADEPAQRAALYEVTLVERWNGINWVVQPAARPTNGELHGVSCTTATTCTAVGDRNASSGTAVTLAEAWKGSGWTIQPAPPGQPTGRSAGCRAPRQLRARRSATTRGLPRRSEVTTRSEVAGGRFLRRWRRSLRAYFRCGRAT